METATITDLSPWAWWRTDNVTGQTNGAELTGWVDSVNSRAMSFAFSSPNRPVWRTANTGDTVLLGTNSKPLIHFNTYPQQKSMVAPMPATLLHTVFLVVRLEPNTDFAGNGYTASPDAYVAGERRNNSGSIVRHLSFLSNRNIGTGGNEFISVANTSSGIVNFGKTSEDHNFLQILTLTWRSAGHVGIRVNEEAETIVSASTITDQGAMNEMVIGGYADPNGGLSSAYTLWGSVLVYDYALPDEQAIRIRQALASLYGINHTTKIFPATAGGYNYIFFPTYSTGARPLKMMIWAHGSSESRSTALVYPNWAAAASALLDDGWIIASCDGGSSTTNETWGAPAAVTTNEALWTHIKTVYERAIQSKLVLLGFSMGGMTVMNCAKNATSTFRTAMSGVILVDPVLDLAWWYDNRSGSHNGLCPSYGITDCDNSVALSSDYASATSGYDPMLAAASAFTPPKFHLRYHSDDIVVPSANHASLMVTKLTGTKTVTTYTTGTGDHGAASRWTPSEIVAAANAM